MAGERTLPGVGLKGFWTDGSDGWGTEMDKNMLVASVLLGRYAVAYSALPGSPVDGDVYINSAAGTYLNHICIRDAGAWIYVPPLTGMLFFVGSGSPSGLIQYSGSTWTAFGSTLVRNNLEDQGFTGGGSISSKDLGTQTTGTLTLDLGDRGLQHYTNGGPHALAPGAVTGAAIVDIVNNGSAGAITTSGFTKVAGDAFTTTNGHKFRCHVCVGQQGSTLNVQALQ